jgi:glycosyltransferase involved in cell wall biosynthesis
MTVICIDGYNLATSKGSGIATYAHNLSGSLRRLEYQTHILYETLQPAADNNLENLVALFDAPPPQTLSRRALATVRGLVDFTPRRGPVVRSVAQTGEVVTRQIERRFPHCDGLWIGQHLFRSANRTYSARGRITPMRFGEGESRMPGVMHWTSPLPLRATGMPNLYTIHDLIPLRLPFATLDNKRRFLSLCRDICASADKVVTVSEHSKRDIISLLGVSEARVAVTYQSVDLPASLTSRPDNDVASEIEGVFGLGWRGYFLFYGAIEPKKNLGRVIEAFLASGVKAPLVIIGGKAWLDDDETRLLYPDIIEARLVRDGAIRRSDRIRVYDYMPLGLLVSLIRGARATLLPSLYEGFGLPVLESMQLGTPVVASTEGSLPEIASDAALLVDPYDSHAISRAIRALDSDADLRADLTARGLRQAEKYSPGAYRTRLAELYRPFT